MSDEPSSEIEPHFPGALPAMPEWLLADWRAHPFDPTPLFEAIPADENAAPLYLRALSEFHPDMADCYPEPQRSDLRKRLLPCSRCLNESFPTGGHMVIDPMRVDWLLAQYEPGLELTARAQQRPRARSP